VSVRFGGLTAVDTVDLAIPEGVIHGVIGPNGAGKTTFFNAITGLVPIGQGAITFAGEDITRRPAYRRARLGMRRTFQSVQLLPQLTVLENVLIGLHDHIRENAWLSLLRPSGRSPEEEEAQQRVIATLRFLGIGETLFRRPVELSFAQRSVEIAGRWWRPGCDARPAGGGLKQQGDGAQCAAAPSRESASPSCWSSTCSRWCSTSLDAVLDGND
jgi:branched-chain amino acid transport system ATP-binding protein